MRRTLWGLANVVMLLAFVFSVVVQFNDPDAFVWIAMYSLAALACALVLLGRGHWVFPAILMVATLAWAAALAPRVLGHVRFLDMFGAFEMANAGIEESREMYGLLVVTVWMAVLTIAGMKGRPRKL
jgi:hypothetical protein